jgi:hypothetical protein
MADSRPVREDSGSGVGVTVSGLVVGTSPVPWQQAARAGTVTAEQVHLTSGQDPAREVAVSAGTRPTSPIYRST